MIRPAHLWTPRACLAIALLVSGSAAADWMANADFTTCPRQYVPQTHGQDGPFSSKEQCDARVAQVQRESPMACARYSCDERGGSGGGGGGGAKPKAGHELDKNINDAISAGMQGKISAGDTVGLVSMGVLGNALLGGLAEDTPEEKARKAARRQAKREARAAAAAQQAAADDAHAQDLLGAMLDTDDEDLDDDPPPASAPSPSPLAPFAPGSTPHWTATAPDAPAQPATGELGMMIGDGPIPTAGGGGAGGGDTQGIMANRRPAQQIRNEPRAVIKQPAAQPAADCDPAAQQLGMMCDENPPAPALTPTPAPAPAPAPAPGQLPAPAPAQQPAADPFIVGVNRGRDHADGCYSQNAGPACSDQAPADFNRCVEGYRSGYRIGEGMKNMRFDEAYRLGQQARANGELNNGASQPGATGTCRIEWIQTYTSGYNGAPRL